MKIGIYYFWLVLLGLGWNFGLIEGKRKHFYEVEDEVPFYVNKIGPYTNPTETYEYYTLPFCKPNEVQHKHSSLGEDLSGVHKLSSLYDIRFRVPVPFHALCKIHLKDSEKKAFIKAIDQFYYFEMLYDDLPLHGFIGTKDRDQYYLFKHLHFTFLWNGNHVIYGNVSASNEPSKILLLRTGDNSDELVEFSYSATWIETNIPFAKRNELYQNSFFKKELEIHWLSIINSCVLVLLLTGFLAIIIMRILKSDYTRYTKAEDEEDDQEDYGWKLVHGDVFRFPPHKNVFSALFGLGIQSFCMFFGILSLAVLGLFHPNNGGALYTSILVLYALTSVIGGFVSAKFFKQMGGEKWAWNIVMVQTLYTLPLFIVFAYDNTLALLYSVTTALPFAAIMIVFSIILFVGFPLTIIGGIIGKRSAGIFEAPVRTKNFPREIPPIPIYRALPVQMIMSGFLPFSAIYIELFYIYSSVWGHSSYQLFGILFLVAIILIIVTACITIALTYFQLSMEDHRWWWHSFLNGGSTGIFIYLYSIFFYVYRSRMSGMLQGSFYFTYMALVCYFFFIMLGSVGFYSSLVFVRQIYKNIKCD